MAEASELSPVLTAAVDAVKEHSADIESDGAPALADKLIKAHVEARKVLADVRKFPAGRRAEADDILIAAAQAYEDWKRHTETEELLFLAELHTSLFKAPQGIDALIARQDAEQLMRRKDMSLDNVFRSMVSRGGALAQLAVSPWLELIAESRNADAKSMRVIAEGEFLKRAATVDGNDTAKRLQDAPAAYKKLRVAMGKIAAECTGTNSSAFAKRALAYGDESAFKDAEIRRLQEQLAAVQK